jgi:hypothetical protein
MNWWLLPVILAGLAAAALWRRLAGRGPAPQAWPRRTQRQRQGLSTVVLDAYGTDWASRFGVSPETLRHSLARSKDPVLASRIDTEVGVVDLRFEEKGTGPTPVQATVMVTYAGTGGRATAAVALPWDDVPGDIRAEFIRKPGDPVWRKWRALADA